jgi:hypothetical protein
MEDEDEEIERLEGAEVAVIVGNVVELLILLEKEEGADVELFGFVVDVEEEDDDDDDDDEVVVVELGIEEEELVVVVVVELVSAEVMVVVVLVDVDIKATLFPYICS